MKKTLLLLSCCSLVALLLLSCNKSNEVRKDKKLSSYFSNSIEKIQISIPNDGFSGNLEISAGKSLAEGVFNQNGNLFNVKIDIPAAYKENFTFEELSENSVRIYDNTLNRNFVVEKIPISNGKTKFRTNLEGKIIEFDFDDPNNRNIIEARIIPLFIAVIAGGVVVLGTAYCAIQSNAARIDCNDVYNRCVSACGRCSYHYVGGVCGGNCSVYCN